MIEFILAAVQLHPYHFAVLLFILATLALYWIISAGWMDIE